MTTGPYAPDKSPPPPPGSPCLRTASCSLGREVVSIFWQPIARRLCVSFDGRVTRDSGEQGDLPHSWPGRTKQKKNFSQTKGAICSKQSATLGRGAAQPRHSRSDRLPPCSMQLGASRTSQATNRNGSTGGKRLFSGRHRVRLLCRIWKLRNDCAVACLCVCVCVCGIPLVCLSPPFCNCTARLSGPRS